jgi:hypothetical protein
MCTYDDRLIAEEAWAEEWNSMSEAEQQEFIRREEEDCRRGLELVDLWPTFSDLYGLVGDEGKAA